MSISLPIKKINSRLLYRIYFATQYKLLHTLQSESKLEEADEGPIDEFTSRLLQNKMEKWELRKSKSTSKILEQNSINIKYKQIVSEENHKETEKPLPRNLNATFRKYLEENKFIEIVQLTRQCIEFKTMPSISVFIGILAICSKNGEKEFIIEFVNACKELREDIFELNSSYDHYLAEALWVKGDIVKSLQMFERVYQEHSDLRREIRVMLKNLICNVIIDRSEAALVSTVIFCEKLLRKYTDILPLSYVWQVCFLSEWYSDQTIALDLFEKHQQLRISVINLIPYVTIVSLQSHRTDILYRLLELLLKHDMKPQCKGVLLSLLDYQIRQRDVRSCSEILKWSSNNDIKLPSSHQTKLLSSLLGPNIYICKPKKEAPLAKYRPHFKF